MSPDVLDPREAKRILDSLSEPTQLYSPGESFSVMRGPLPGMIGRVIIQRDGQVMGDIDVFGQTMQIEIWAGDLASQSQLNE